MPKWFIGPNVFSDKVMTPTEASYLAAFIDGEGTISLYKTRRKENRSGYRLQPNLSVANTDLPALEAIQAMCGNGRIVQTTNPSKPHHKPGYILKMSPNQIRHVLPQVRPYLLIKGKQADYVLEFLSLNVGGRHLTDASQERADGIRDAVRGLNARGLPVTVQ